MWYYCNLAWGGGSGSVHSLIILSCKNTIHFPLNIWQDLIRSYIKTYSYSANENVVMLIRLLWVFFNSCITRVKRSDLLIYDSSSDITYNLLDVRGRMDYYDSWFVCRGFMSCLGCLCLPVYSSVQHILIVLCLCFIFIRLCFHFLDCPFFNCPFGILLGLFNQIA